MWSLYIEHLALPRDPLKRENQKGQTFGESSGRGRVQATEETEVSVLSQESRHLNSGFQLSVVGAR